MYISPLAIFLLSDLCYIYTHLTLKMNLQCNLISVHSGCGSNNMKPQTHHVLCTAGWGRNCQHTPANSRHSAESCHDRSRSGSSTHNNYVLYMHVHGGGGGGLYYITLDSVNDHNQINHISTLLKCGMHKLMSTWLVLIDGESMTCSN